MANAIKVRAMTPKACSLYDWIKLYKLKNGYWPHLEELPAESRVTTVDELVNDYWAKRIQASMKRVQLRPKTN